MAFGGAGGLHLCELADALSMTQAMIPVHAGIFSALGLLLAPQGRELSQTVPGRLRDMDETEIGHRFDTLAERIHEEAGGEVSRAWRQTRDLDLRYEGAIRSPAPALGLDRPDGGGFSCTSPGMLWLHT